MAARRQPVFVVVFLSQVLGLALVGALALALRAPMPPQEDILRGAGAGVSGAIGVGALYASLAAGRMGIAAPITGVLAAILPVSYAWVTGGLPGAFGVAGVALAVLGLVLVSAPKAERPPPRVLLLATLSGLGFAGFLLLMGTTSGASFLGTLTAARAGSAAIMLVVVLAVRQPWGRPTPWVLGAALGDTLGNAFFLLAATLGPLDDAVVLSALYPVATVVLARVVLHERLTRTQAWGSGMMIAAIPLVLA